MHTSHQTWKWLKNVAKWGRMGWGQNRVFADFCNGCSDYTQFHISTWCLRTSFPCKSVAVCVPIRWGVPGGSRLKDSFTGHYFPRPLTFIFTFISLLPVFRTLGCCIVFFHPSCCCIFNLFYVVNCPENFLLQAIYRNAVNYVNTVYSVQEVVCVDAHTAPAYATLQCNVRIGYSKIGGICNFEYLQGKNKFNMTCLICYFSFHILLEPCWRTSCIPSPFQSFALSGIRGQEKWIASVQKIITVYALFCILSTNSPTIPLPI